MKSLSKYQTKRETENTNIRQIVDTQIDRQIDLDRYIQIQIDTYYMKIDIDTYQMDRCRQIWIDTYQINIDIYTYQIDSQIEDRNR